MNISYEWYRIFVCVAECESITAAAERLYISQPAVSQVIRQLEDALRCTLFVRSSRGVRLTAEGETLYRHAAQGVAAFSEGERQLAELVRLESGEIRVGASDLTMDCLLPYIEAFRREYPRIGITLLGCGTREALAWLREGKLDFAGVAVAFPDGDAALTPLREFRDIFVCAPDYGVPDGVSVADLQDELILLTADTNTRAFLDGEFARRGMKVIPRMELPTVDGILRFAALGMGVGCVMSDLAENAVAEGKLREIRVRDPLPPRHICIARASETRSKAADALLEMILSGKE